jgi:isoleucyl-tRNA synthetase
LYRVHYALTRLIAPLLSFTAEEVWSHTAKPVGAPESVHMALFPEPEELASGLDQAAREKWDRLMEIRADVLKALEDARQAKFIGAPLEARVRLQGYPGLEDSLAELPSLFIVSEVALDPGSEKRVTVERADGTKCERCWKYSTKVGEDVEFPTVCDSCSAALKEMNG